MYQNSVLGNFLWRSGAESFAWCTYNILVQGGGGLPPPVGGSVGGRGRQRPPPKETPCSCTSRACTMYLHCTHPPGAMANGQFQLHSAYSAYSMCYIEYAEYAEYLPIVFLVESPKIKDLWIRIKYQLAVLSRPFGLVLCCFTSRDSLASSLSSSDLISSCTNWMMEYTRRRRSDILPICKRNIVNVCSHLLLYHRRIWH